MSAIRRMPRTRTPYLQENRSRETHGSRLQRRLLCDSLPGWLHIYMGKAWQNGKHATNSFILSMSLIKEFLREIRDRNESYMQSCISNVLRARAIFRIINVERKCLTSEMLFAGHALVDSIQSNQCNCRRGARSRQGSRKHCGIVAKIYFHQLNHVA